MLYMPGRAEASLSPVTKSSVHTSSCPMQREVHREMVGCRRCVLTVTLSRAMPLIGARCSSAPPSCSTRSEAITRPARVSLMVGGNEDTSCLCTGVEINPVQQEQFGRAWNERRGDFFTEVTCSSCGRAGLDVWCGNGFQTSANSASWRKIHNVPFKALLPHTHSHTHTPTPPPPPPLLLLL